MVEGCLHTPACARPLSPPQAPILSLSLLPGSVCIPISVCGFCSLELPGRKGPDLPSHSHFPHWPVRMFLTPSSQDILDPTGRATPPARGHPSHLDSRPLLPGWVFSAQQPKGTCDLCSQLTVLLCSKPPAVGLSHPLLGVRAAPSCWLLTPPPTAPRPARPSPSLDLASWPFLRRTLHLTLPLPASLLRGV